MSRRWLVRHTLGIAITIAVMSILGSSIATAATTGLEEARAVPNDALVLWQKTCITGTRCPKPPGQDFAILTFERRPDGVFIDGRAAGEVSGEGLAALTPGEHLLYVLSWPTWRIEFQPGHVYGLKTEYVNVPDRRHFLWVENTKTGEIVAGEPPDDRIELTQRSDTARYQRLTRERFEKTLRDAGCGDMLAQHRAGFHYLAGLEPLVSRNAVQAHVWYGMAATRGDAAAEAVRKRIAAELSPEQLEIARRAATETPVADCPKDGATR